MIESLYSDYYYSEYDSPGYDEPHQAYWEYWPFDNPIDNMNKMHRYRLATLLHLISIRSTREVLEDYD